MKLILQYFRLRVMPVDHSVTFYTGSAPDDGNKTMKAYLMWVKSHHTIWKAFPMVNRSEFYKRVQMHGLQPFWTTTWFDRFISTSTIGEAGADVNHGWATLLLYHLDQIWPKLDNITEDDWNTLTIIDRCSNRIKGACFHGIGIATKSPNPDRLEGFIDLFEDVAANEEIRQWATKQFLPTKK